MKQGYIKVMTGKDMNPGAVTVQRRLWRGKAGSARLQLPPTAQPFKRDQ